MENVVAFNNELSSLYDQKPPISKAKMAAITKSAMRAIKFYKHVVQSVEKFILKCKPEYKVPGLYVIDSIVRQSRHQFGPDKDVFAPRFARNIKETFANLFRCAPDDKSRIIRVLNLWQKNNVFAPEVIQPIFDLADPNHPIYQIPPPGATGGTGGDIPSGAANGLNTSSTSMEMNLNASGSSDDKHGGMPDLSSMSHEKAQSVLDNSTLRQLEHMQQYLKRHSVPATTVSSTKSREMRESRDMREIRESRELREMRESRDSREHRELREMRDIREVRDSRELRDSRVDRDAHEYARLIDSGATAGSGSNNRNPNSSGNAGASSSITSGGGGANKSQHAETYAKYSKTTHEVIIEDDDGPENTNSPKHASKIIDNNNLQQLLNDPNVLLQLQTLQNFQKMKQQEEQQYKMNEMRMQEKEFEKHLQTVLKTQAAVHGVTTDSSEFNKEVEFVSVEQKIEVINLDGNDSRSPSPAHDRDRYKSSRRRSSRSRSRSRDRGRRRRSRSRSRSRSPRGSYRRRSSRDRDRDRSERSSLRDKEKEREHERERRRKGLPEIKKEHLSVCSTTLWVGHLSKLVYQEELSDTFGAYGDIVSIDLIVPRGCAFIVMNRRQDAHKAMQNLKNHKLQGRAITISWAAGKGVKSKEWKDFWDLELGVTYIPWSKLDTDTDFDALEEGGMFDEDSMPGWVKDKINHIKSLKEKSVDSMANMPPGAPPAAATGNAGLLFGIDTTQPPPGPPPTSGPPPKMPMVPVQFPMAPPMGGPPRMLGPMGPMPISGIPMPPNMVPGMPPPHPMMLPAGIIPQAFPPIPGQVTGGSGPPPGMGPPMGMPPPGGPGPYHPPPTAIAGVVPPPVAANASSSDDQMDIEMDEEDGPSSANIPTPVSAPSMNFNQPPPMFAGPGGVPGGDNSVGDIFSRDRGRERGGAGGGSRWGERGGAREEVDLVEAAKRWRENGGQSNFNEGGGMGGGPPNFNDGGMSGPPNFNEGSMGGGPPNFNEGGMGGGPPNFNDGGRGGRSGGPMNIQALDINNPPHRPDFMNDFDGRGGPRGGPGGPRGGGNHNGDFFPNMQNRFNQPTSLMQMRIPPPNAFNQRMGGPMFMRGGHGGPGGGPGQAQGPGRQGFFNPRNPFDRDVPGRGSRGGRGGRGGGRGGGSMGSHGAPGSWSDEEGDDGNMFMRRGPSGPGGPGGNRFRERDGSEEWHGRGGPGGNRRGGGRDRSERGDHRDNERGDRSRGAGRRNSRDESRDASKSSSKFKDTEDDWDLELEEYKPESSARQSAKDANNSKTVKNKEDNIEIAAKKSNEDVEEVQKNESTFNVVEEPALPEQKQELPPVEKETYDTPQSQPAIEVAAPEPAPSPTPEAPAFSIPQTVDENNKKVDPAPETPAVEKVASNGGDAATQSTGGDAEKPTE